MSDVKSGTLYGVGLGPGDPDLVTVKAARVLRRAPVVAYFRKRGHRGHARTIAAPHLGSVIEAAFDYPMTTEIYFRSDAYVEAIRDFYSASARTIMEHLTSGRDVALLCEGDPFFYGSFLHMYDRIKGSHPVSVIPGITGMSGCWTAAAAPITYGDDVLTILPGTLGEADLAAHLRTADAAVIMKVGKNLAKVKAALADAGRMGEAIYVERGTMEGERVVPLRELGDDAVPYFSIILLPGGRGRRIV
ncbi:precorrin-2 C(20)-methyltransferase [Hyphomicrobium methylovorum]|uniref:precorrin-2 C(20)-methyltransferase n=1 Tax=Hyphomicrobium methylovorum TaxID=84 RepID=UPI0015E78AF9|nr:precorrin-2 C(20)-methyltransferase [Hyphomicrobium methylovorum]MBA2126749.1 precorrin-2 C(20)-methyltransferase [Hyphomicrobium methylovorum]